ncbi:MerR-like DNA binding protein [Rhodothalassium salexigens DSM 2132]|uniref:MerR-like DNA binding protein n=1 Tax=Rhodothalassium salexigens DSM 2132 TaxID=1188247 RepID=A0A4R2PT21_RHOSA|nr:MerR family transcriptional regulator [Rhodothalassium salexigens]MBB4209973.1 DNA-binding transcriptional MerR regulator [Rhodothalassium salexigens DSM 2132]MBK1637655.1 hypothetical protein [Rhodothalassium salexigens DSM 2132]TCP38138.1 MerR-like DNA binding protein [Rhodothalassium salexigens DSM 2132]
MTGESSLPPAIIDAEAASQDTPQAFGSADGPGRTAPDATDTGQPPTRATDKAAGAYRTISEVSAELDLPAHVLRFWETKFSQVRPLKRGGNRRYYRPQDVEVLRAIKALLYTDGVTIKGVQKLFRDKGLRATVHDRLASDAGLASLIGAPRDQQPAATSSPSQTSPTSPTPSSALAPGEPAPRGEPASSAPASTADLASSDPARSAPTRDRARPGSAPLSGLQTPSDAQGLLTELRAIRGLLRG